MKKWSTLKFEQGLESAEKVCFSLPLWVGMMFVCEFKAFPNVFSKLHQIENNDRAKIYPCMPVPVRPLLTFHYSSSKLNRASGKEIFM